MGVHHTGNEHVRHVATLRRVTGSSPSSTHVVEGGRETALAQESVLSHIPPQFHAEMTLYRDLRCWMTKTCKNVPGSGTSLLLFLTLAFASG